MQLPAISAQLTQESNEIKISDIPWQRVSIFGTKYHPMQCDHHPDPPQAKWHVDRPTFHQQSQETKPCSTHTMLTRGKAGKCVAINWESVSGKRKEDHRKFGGPPSRKIYHLQAMGVTWRAAKSVANDRSRWKKLVAQQPNVPERMGTKSPK